MAQLICFPGRYEVSKIRYLLEDAPVRTSVRFPLQLEIVLYAPERSYHAITEDISANGVLFSSDEVPPVGTRVEFRMTMPSSIMGGTETVLLDCIGRVVRHARTIGKRRAAVVIDEYLLRAE
jgi:hypothetical protein